MSGAPFAANPLAALYYLPNWPLFFLPWIPLAVGFNLSSLVHLVLAGTTMYALMHLGLGVDVWGGLVAAAAFQMSPKLLAHLGAGHVGWVQAWAWLPLVLLCTLKACQSTGPRANKWALLAGLAMAVQFCADVRLSAYTLMASTFLVLARAVDWLDARRRSELCGTVENQTLIGAIGPAAIALTTFAGLAACQWLPGLSLLPDTTRSAMTLRDAAIWSLPWRYLGGLLLADRGGFQEWMTYVGVSTLALASTGGGLLWRARHRRWLLAWLIAMGVFGVWFSLGEHGGLFQLLWGIVPGLGLLRVPPRAWVLVSFATAILAGFGVQAVRRRARRSTRAKRRRQVLLGVAAFPPVFTAVYWVAIGSPPLNLVIFSLMTPLAVALCGAPFANEASCHTAWLGIAALCLVAIDLLLVDLTLIEARSPREVFAHGETAAQWLADQPGRFRVYSPSYSLPQHVSERYGLEMADGVDPLQLKSYADYLTQAAGLPDRQAYGVTLPPFPEGRDIRTALVDVSPSTDMLGQLGVRYVASAFPIDHSRLEFVKRLGDVYLYLNEDAQPLGGRSSDLGIALANGEVIFWYRPWAVYAGWIISGLTLMVVSICLWRFRKPPTTSRSGL